jgi:hypothetical protein
LEPNPPQHDETIVPVRPNLRGAAAAPTEAPPAAPRLLRQSLTALGAVAFLAAAAAAFYWLPARVEEERVVARPAAEPAAAAEPARPVLSAEEREALRAQAGDLLAGLLTLQDDLTQLNVADWAAEDWAKFQQLSEAGDNAFLRITRPPSRATQARLGDALCSARDDAASPAPPPPRSPPGFEAGSEQYAAVFRSGPCRRWRAARVPSVCPKCRSSCSARTSRSRAASSYRRSRHTARRS